MNKHTLYFNKCILKTKSPLNKIIKRLEFLRVFGLIHLQLYECWGV